MRWRGALLALLPAMLAGCGAQVTLQGHTVSEGRAKVLRPAGALASRDGQIVQSVREVWITLTPAVRQQLGQDTLFDADVLREAIQKELASRGQLDAEGTGPVAEILVDDFRLEPAGEAAFMGKVTADGRIGSRVRLLGVDLVEQRSFNLLAEAQVGIAREGRDPDALRALYRRFALQLGNEFAGTPEQSALPEPGQARR